MVMRNIDRHLTINAGWVAGPAFGAIMTGAGLYFDIARQLGAALFWGGIAVFVSSILVAFAVSKGKSTRVIGPFIMICSGVVLICAGSAWYFWPNGQPTHKPDITIFAKCHWNQVSFYIYNLSRDYVNVFFPSTGVAHSLNENEPQAVHFALPEVGITMYFSPLITPKK